MSSSVDKYFEKEEEQKPKDENLGLFCYIGVDPGKDGFITAYGNDRYEFYEMPTHKVETGELLKSGKPKTKDEFHIHGLVHIANKIQLDFPNHFFKVAIEEVGGRGGNGATQNFNFGFTAGMQRMIFEFLGAEIITVRPQKWQSFVRKGYPDLKKASSTGKTQIRDPKAVAEMIVKKEFPEIDFRKSTRAKKES